MHKEWLEKNPPPHNSEGSGINLYRILCFLYIFTMFNYQFFKLSFYIKKVNDESDPQNEEKLSK